MRQQVMWMLRLGIAGTFTGHGYYAFCARPSWIPLICAFGFSDETARHLLPLIGLLDWFIALLVLIKPLRPVLIWAACWAFMTSFSRILAGEPVWEFIERFSNWACPLALLFLQKKSVHKNWLKTSAGKAYFSRDLHPFRQGFATVKPKQGMPVK